MDRVNDPAARWRALCLLDDWLATGFARPHSDLLVEAPPEVRAAAPAAPAPAARAAAEDAAPAAPAPGTVSVGGPVTDRVKLLEEVASAVASCTLCGLCANRTTTVPGEGPLDPHVLFIGEGPGAEEDRTGRPFVGAAGQYLDTWLPPIGLKREQCFIANCVKCRPPQNRTPLGDEVASCRPFLDGQIDAVRPRVIVALGKPATSLLLGRDVSITRVRGTWHEDRGTPLLPTFHPAFVLRQYTPENRRLVWEDLKAALARARELGARI